ncbi:hypothetical protein AB0H29_24585 [Streptomyces thermolilacinus]
MRDAIARSLMWVLRLVLPARGRHAAAAPAPERLPEAEHVNPWSRPWGGPSSAQARAIFHPEEDEETTLPLSPIQRERRYAAAFAMIGVDYDYPGAPFVPGRTVVRVGVSA